MGGEAPSKRQRGGGKGKEMGVLWRGNWEIVVMLLDNTIFKGSPVLNVKCLPQHVHVFLTLGLQLVALFSGPGLLFADGV